MGMQVPLFSLLRFIPSAELGQHLSSLERLIRLG
jgi:hypothetical protein